MKPDFAKNIIARRKALGWNGHRLAEAADVPYPTLRDIEAGISSGREETKTQIANALGCSVGDLYETEHINRSNLKPSRSILVQLIETPETLPYKSLSRVIEELLAVAPEIRATVLAILYDDPNLAEAYLSKNGIRAKTLKAR